MDKSAALNDQPEKSFDPALFDVTKIPVDDFANQITIDDFEIFKRITPDEVNFIIFSIKFPTTQITSTHECWANCVIYEVKQRAFTTSTL